MTVKIIKTVRDSSTVLRIDGDLCGESVGELKKVCTELKALVCLELAELRHVDDEGIEVLLTMINEGAQILSINPYFDLLLKTKRGDAPALNGAE